MDGLSKKLEKQNKDLKVKLVLTENLVQKRQQETDALRMKLEKRLQNDEKWLISDKQQFEKLFGRAPSQNKGDDKVSGIFLCIIMCSI